MENKQKIIHDIMLLAPVIPVVVVEEVGHAVKLAKALVAGGLPAIEVTLRTPVALEALKAIAEEVEGAFAGAGTVVTPAQIKQVEEAGAKFMVSPGVSENLLDAADDSPLPLLPGTATASEVMRLGERGYGHMKFFPGSLAGGAPYLKALSGPLPDYRFCPTGGVSLANAGEYLGLQNVLCVGGSWVAPKNLVEARDWDGITKIAREAAGLK
ncbi:MAG: bifunctional 4-hydroxy-2-oxoglutarate aldolase/2-dehydro-3-deoxy-phosphogluconate aldolase [Rhizobiaceae bacterium]|nr:bifunctional 4-hydroxy-2-oxoglutarate aldolase/2-dehydro-3-deoxy-phosphogluconate aldolase [Rhizobiaceae bacterium]